MDTDPEAWKKELIAKEPLILFSLYTHIQKGYLKTFGDELLILLDTSRTVRSDGTIVSDGRNLSRAHGLFWLWILGAYEVVRTMCQAEKCFSVKLVEELKHLKARLARIRMPFAKQELEKKKAPAWREFSAVGFGSETCDIEFSVDGQHYTCRQLIAEFEKVFSGIKSEDVLADHRTLYPNWRVDCPPYSAADGLPK